MTDDEFKTAWNNLPRHRVGQFELLHVNVDTWSEVRGVKMRYSFPPKFGVAQRWEYAYAFEVVTGSSMEDLKFQTHSDAMWHLSTARLAKMEGVEHWYIAPVQRSQYLWSRMPQ